MKSIRTEGGIHNIYVTPDGKFVVAGSIPGKKINVIDAETEEIVVDDADRRRRAAHGFETNADGSTRRIFVQLSDFNGFITVDLTTHQVVDESSCPRCPPPRR